MRVLQARARSKAFDHLPKQIDLATLNRFNRLEIAEQLIRLIEPAIDEIRLHCLGKSIAKPHGVGRTPPGRRTHR